MTWTTSDTLSVIMVDTYIYNVYKDGFSSNRFEGVFAHLKSMWRGIYHWFSKRYSQLYLVEESRKEKIRKEK